MLAVIILGLIILLIVSSFLFKKKNVADKTKTTSNTKKILAITVLGIFVLMIISTLMSDGVKSIYCLSDDKCVTVWKRTNGEVYIILGEYKGKKVPSDNYVKMTNVMFNYIDVIFKQENKLLISLGDKANVEQKSSNGLIELYRDNKAFNDSLYTYFDGRYRKYKENVDFISIDIKENYATDKTGKKIK